MPTLSWKDYRLPDDDIAPYDTTVMFVSQGMTIAELVSETAKWADENAGTNLYLMIYCHGAPGYLQICKEIIQYYNAKKLASLSPYFSGVSIHACLIAKGSVGRAFCVRLAQVLDAPVTGAVKLQQNTGPVTMYGFLDDKKYDGEYYIHKKTGAREGPLVAETYVDYAFD